MKQQSVISFFVGLIFAVGLGISGMTNPKNVVSFLDVFGNWNPSLLFVMAGAIIIHFILFRLIHRRAKPIFDKQFHLPTKTKIDRRLLTGAIIFGIGWGLAGYCPGPAITALAGFSSSSFLFVTSMLIGMLLIRIPDLLKRKSS